MELLQPIYHFLVYLFGGAFTFAFFIVSLFCAISALLSLSNENRVFFVRICRGVGVGLSIFGFLLPFRGISFFATLLCVWWTSQLFSFVPAFDFIQAAVSTVLTIIFWTKRAFMNDSSFFEIAGDITVYVVLPIVFILVKLSRGSDQLTNSRKSDSGPKIPLAAWLSFLAKTVSRLFPPQS